MKDQELICNDLIDDILKNTKQDQKIKDSLRIYKEAMKALEDFNPALVRKELWPKKYLPTAVFNNVSRI